MNPDEQKDHEKSRIELVQSDMDAWKFLLEFHRISDQDIKDILCWDHSLSSDDARRAILKIYSYETPLYSAINRANHNNDESAIKTLGPFSRLLDLTLVDSPKENKDMQGENTTHEGQYKWERRITLYRGLGLPE